MYIFILIFYVTLLFQHGESEFNVIGRIGGDAPLSPRGRLYAQALTKHIHTLNLHSLQVWTSTLQRTKATSANIQAPQLHLRELDEIFSVNLHTVNYVIILFTQKLFTKLIAILKIIQSVQLNSKPKPAYHAFKL